MAARDNRRISGPEKTTPICVLQKPKYIRFLNSEGARSDSRGPLDVRKLYFGLGSISQAKGSSYVEWGSTKVVSGVYGPKEAATANTFKMTGQVLCEVKLAPFSCRGARRPPQPDRHMKELSKQVKEALEAAIMLDQYPKAQIDVYVTVVEDGGSLLAACLTAASLALCDARIHLYDVVVAASLVWHEGQIYLDPTSIEEECAANAGERHATPQQAQCYSGPSHTNNSDPSVSTSSAKSITTHNQNSGSSISTHNRHSDSNINSMSKDTSGSQYRSGTSCSGLPVVNGVGSSEPSSNGCLTVGLMPVYANSQVALMVQSGVVSVDDLMEGLDLALESCRKIYSLVKQVLLDHATATLVAEESPRHNQDTNT